MQKNKEQAMDPSIDELLLSIRQAIEEEDAWGREFTQNALPDQEISIFQNTESLEQKIDDFDSSEISWFKEKDAPHILSTSFDSARLDSQHLQEIENLASTSFIDKKITPILEDSHIRSMEQDEWDWLSSSAYTKGSKENFLEEKEPNFSEIESDFSLLNNIEPSNVDKLAHSLVSSSVAQEVEGQLRPLLKLLQSKSLIDQKRVESLLHPLLAQWLENNLPGLVEKIIREEIQRLFVVKR